VAPPSPGRIPSHPPAEGIVEQAEKGDTEHVDHPPTKLGIEQVEVRAIVEHGERREREQRAGDQRGAGGKRDLPAGVVRPREPGASHVAKPGPE
jgi:hypothetical protein